MRKFAFAVAISALAGPVLAGGPIEPVVEQPVVAAAPVQGFDWTGFYVGANAGVGASVDGAGDTYDTTAYGVQTGYLYDWGNWAVGGELAYGVSSPNDVADVDFTAARLKLIGGYAAGRLLPYAFVGLSNYSIEDGIEVSDTATLYGVGVRYALGATGRHVIGLEYLSETQSDFDGTGFELDASEFVLRYDFRF